MKAPRHQAEHSLRRRIHTILDGGKNDWLSRLIHVLLVTLVVASVAAVILQSVPEYDENYDKFFRFIENISVSIFTLELALRLWTAPEHTPYASQSAFRARISFMKSGGAIIDLVSVMPFYLSIFVSTDLRVLLLLRLVRFFKLARYSSGIRTIIAVLEAEKRALLASGLILFGVVLFAAAAMHLAEHEAQPDKFDSIPAAMWWAIVTITTLGYGDVTPITLAGRLIASATMVMGYVMLGLPVGIVATAFSEEIHRREFVVTWSMIARVPLFRSLGATEIAEIMRYLRAQSVPKDTLIVRRGEIAHSMYFIAEGAVEIDLPNQRIQLGEGQFFGEVSVLKKTLRSGNVRTTQPTKLLILDAYDLRTVMIRNPKIGEAIQEMAHNRSELKPRNQQGDMIAAELEPLANVSPSKDEDQ
ncbi:MAG: cyclic nucleotide-binding protein [Methylocystaceae bacterium]|nr:cyclic nucleotide-binding protein [Methylocystaceae bacterium]